MEILKDDGVTGLWRGLKASLVLTVVSLSSRPFFFWSWLHPLLTSRLCAAIQNPALTYGSFERLKPLVLTEGQKMTPGKAFILGALSKTIATVITFPYILAKVRLQAKYNDEDDTTTLTDGNAAVVQKKKERYANAIDVLKKVYNEKGFSGLYQVSSESEGTACDARPLFR